ncbi:tripartite tricarboxylate transporter permease [Rhizobium sp. P32RR-XVIII]|uniref:tripartite tricarboxylate transporter permease n=1 Tax=Rhizobium sp. P32RR-XVIII TaxID=2726738 RepID=UPI001456DE1B|nr:tripartite tricarboxylate transporter permease [Rhizobium sp. P32RR-XVIII]NLS07573.1 tripartite tricarboxylate transporter permease [Rhizobium sp. P32RR-XVIII]
MDAFFGLAHGFGVALQPMNIVWCFAGCFLGTVIGILPGLGPAATIAILLPVTYNMDPVGGIIMLSGIYYGAKYGGSTTSILLNMPGEASSVVSCIDGYQMARKGRAGPALGIAAIASFIAGTIGVVALSLIAPPIAQFALSFSSPEYFALMILGLSLVVLLGGNSIVKAMLSLVLGLSLASIGTDLFTAQSRFTFGQSSLLDGIDFMTVAIGLFAITEILLSIAAREKSELLDVPKGIRNLLPSWEELKACRFAFINGSITGFFIGLLPGAGSSIASFVSYGIEKAVSKHPERFGHGAPEGLAAPEGANNADTGGALLPLLTLGIPGGTSTAILLSALVLWGVKPGPLMMQESPDIFWGLVASMYVGNVVLLIMNLPLVGVFAQILRVPIFVLHPVILGVSIAGAYGISGSLFDVGLLVGFGLLGWVMSKLSFPTAPLILGFVLGDALERALRQSLTMSNGDVKILFDRPISAVLLILAALILVSPLLRRFNTFRMQALKEDGV